MHDGVNAGSAKSMNCRVQVMAGRSETAEDRQPDEDESMGSQVSISACLGAQRGGGSQGFVPRSPPLLLDGPFGVWFQVDVFDLMRWWWRARRVEEGSGSGLGLGLLVPGPAKPPPHPPSPPPRSITASLICTTLLFQAHTPAALPNAGMTRQAHCPDCEPGHLADTNTTFLLQ
ncbi:unnamed protein product [Pleuronectes platessa]|uniref:Uncharacterized protein n=1 Tax=Pleuronectes platessa TaxID=8262 RepID=A0A9N7YQC5_PLEPL|nr:unnamed protein product [Pleuronectes platessa]